MLEQRHGRQARFKIHGQNRESPAQPSTPSPESTTTANTTNPDSTSFPGMIEAAAAHKTFAKRFDCTLEEAAAFQAILVTNFIIGGVIDKPQPLSNAQARFIILNTHHNLIHVFSPADQADQHVKDLRKRFLANLPGAGLTLHFIAFITDKNKTTTLIQ